MQAPEISVKSRDFWNIKRAHTFKEPMICSTNSTGQQFSTVA